MKHNSITYPSTKDEISKMVDDATKEWSDLQNDEAHMLLLILAIFLEIARPGAGVHKRQDLATAIDTGFYKMWSIRIANLNRMSDELYLMISGCLLIKYRIRRAT